MNDGRLNLELLNQGFFEAEQYINPTIANYSKKYTSIWRSRIPRGVFQYGQGYTMKSRQFYGGLAIQDETRSWREVKPSRAANPATGDPGYDACRYDAPVIGYGLEEKQFKIYETMRRTTDLCLSDILYTWQFEQQLSLMFQMLGDITIGEWENVCREHYVNFSTKLAANGNMQEITIPFGADTISMGACDLNSIGRLNQDMLDRIYMFLYRQCPMAALGNSEGKPVYGLVTSAETSQDIIRKDPTRAEWYKYAAPQVLIDGLGTVRTIENFAHILDPMTMRFKVNPADPTQLIRVWPYKQTPTTIGDSVRVDQEYIDAPFEASVIFLNDVFKTLVPPANPTNLSGHEFGPADNMGDFKWLNIQDREENLLKEKGFFFARFRMAPEPLQYYRDAVTILHRRCTDVPVVVCNTATTSSTSARKILSVANYDSDATTNTKIKVVLEGSMTGAGLGSVVTVVDGNSAAVATDAVVVDDSGDGVYIIDMLVVKVGGWAEAILDGSATPTVDLT
jgi:microcompartment protein CcmK/EutM